MVRIFHKVFSCCTGKEGEGQKGEEIEITEMAGVNGRANTGAGGQSANGTAGEQARSARIGARRVNGGSEGNGRLVRSASTLEHAHATTASKSPQHQTASTSPPYQTASASPQHQTASFKRRAVDPIHESVLENGPIQVYKTNGAKSDANPDEIQPVQTTQAMQINVKQALVDREALFARLRRPNSVAARPSTPTTSCKLSPQGTPIADRMRDYVPTTPTRSTSEGKTSPRGTPIADRMIEQGRMSREQTR